MQYGLMMLLLIMLARTLGKPGLGLFSYLNSLVIPIWVAIEFGLDNYLVRDLAAIPHRSHALASQAASVRLVFAIAALVFIVPFIAATQESETAKFGVILLCTAFLPRAFTSSYFSVLRSQQRYYHAMRFDMLGALIVTICAVGILLTTKSLLAVITISASVDFLKCAVVLPLYKRELGASLMRSLDLHITRHKDFIKRTAPFAALNVIVILYLRVDVLLLEHFRNVNDVGVFTAGERFINVPLAFPAAMYGSLLPMFSEARGKEYAKGFAKLSILLFMAIGVIASVVIYYCASFAIGVTFQFPESVVVLQILGWSFAFNIFNLISESWLYGNGLERRCVGGTVYRACRHHRDELLFCAVVGRDGHRVFNDNNGNRIVAHLCSNSLSCLQNERAEKSICRRKRNDLKRFFINKKNSSAASCRARVWTAWTLPLYVSPARARRRNILA